MASPKTRMKADPGSINRSAGFDQRKHDILRQAALAFVENGYHQTSVSDLAIRLGVTKPVLYYYVKNKDDLLFQCGQIARDELDAAMVRARGARFSGIGRLRHFFAAYAEIMCGDFGRCLALVDLKSLEPETRAADIAARRGIEAAVREMIVDGQQDGSIRDCDPAVTSRALFGAFNGIPRWYAGGGALTSGDVADAFIDLFFEGLRRR